MIDFAFPFGAMAERQRDMFPLPALFGDSSLDGCRPGSRRSRARLARRLELDGVAADSVAALNSLMAVGSTAAPRGPVAGHASVRQHLLGCARDMGPAPAMSPLEAFGELRGASPYDDHSGGYVQPLNFATLSLPDAGSSPVAVAELYGAGGHDFVDKFCRECLAVNVAARLCERTS